MGHGSNREHPEVLAEIGGALALGAAGAALLRAERERAAR